MTEAAHPDFVSSNDPADNMQIQAAISSFCITGFAKAINGQTVVAHSLLHDVAQIWLTLPLTADKARTIADELYRCADKLDGGYQIP